MLLRLARCPRPARALARGLASTPFTPAEDAGPARRKMDVYYERIARKSPTQSIVQVTNDRVDVTAAFLVKRGMSRLQALRAISLHVAIMSYSPNMMQSKINWLSELGLSEDKINDTILRHPGILGTSMEKLEAIVKWYLDQGVPRNKIAYVFNVFPQAASYSIRDNLEPKARYLRELGCNEKQVARFMSMAPQMFSLSLERLRAGVQRWVSLGVPEEKLPAIICSVPQSVGLTSARIKETADTLDELFGEGAGVRALTWNCRIVMYSTDVLRESFKYLISVGFTKERLEVNTRYITRNTTRFLRPRVEFLETKSYDIVEQTAWILLPDSMFIQQFPEYQDFLVKYKAKLKSSST